MRPHRLFISCCSAALLGGLLLCAGGCTEPEAISFHSSSDSLLNLPVHQKYSYVTLLLSRKKKEDLNVRLHYLDSLKQIYKAQGTPDDLLLLEISSFSTGTCTPLDANSTLAWGAKLIREAEQLQDTFALATIHQRVSTYYYKYVHDYGKSFQHLLKVITNDLLLGFYM